MNARRFSFGMFAIVVAALACRQGQPANDPKPEPNSPVPSVDRPDKDDTTTTTSGPPSPLKRDGG
jgi:hypothetical protein